MNRPVRFFVNRPVWLKLVLVFGLAVIIPVVVLLFTVDRDIRQADRVNLERYLADESSHRRENITAVFINAEQYMANFVENYRYAEQIRRVLTGGQTSLDLDERMSELLVASGPFEEAAILSPEGFVLMNGSTPATTAPRYTLDANFSGTPTYDAAQALLRLGQLSDFVLSRGEGPLLELVYVVEREGEPFGFVVATLDYESTVLPLLDEQSAFLDSVHSYLATRSGIVLSAQAANSVSVSPVGAAVDGESGFAIYEFREQSLLGYYGPIAGTPFALITEVPEDTSFTLPVIGLYDRILLLVLLALAFSSLVATFAGASILTPLRRLQGDMQAMLQNDFARPVTTAERQDEIGQLAGTFVNLREQVGNLVDNLEARVAARERDFRATQEVSRFAVTQRDLQLLMDTVVHRIVTLFPNIYHAQIFLVDSEGRSAVLRASTGQPGQRLLARGHRLEVGGVSVVGRATEEGRVVITRDTDDSDIHRPNEFLLETQAEMALPLRVGENVIGVLDVQSKQSNSFAEEQINTLKTMADQIAIAIENARLYEESLRRLEALEERNRQTTRAAWREYMLSRRAPALVREVGPSAAPTGDYQPLHERAIAEKEAVIGAVTASETVPLVVPVRLRGQVLGTVEWEIPVDSFSQDRVELAQELVDRLAVSLENARLFQENERATARERLVNEIATRLSSQTKIDDILQTAVKEVGQALHAPHVSIQLRVRDSTEENAPLTPKEPVSREIE